MSRGHKEHRNMSEALKEFVQTNKLQAGLDKIDVREAWKELMGNGVNNYTTNVLLKNNTLYVQLSSSVLREELSYGKSKIIALINEHLGKPLVQELILR